jgi:hypothetical protein
MNEVKDGWRPQTIIGGAYEGTRLVFDNVRSWEWETIPRREPRSPRERLGPIRSQACAPDPLTEVVE